MLHTCCQLICDDHYVLFFVCSPHTSYDSTQILLWLCNVFTWSLFVVDWNLFSSVLHNFDPQKRTPFISKCFLMIVFISFILSITIQKIVPFIVIGKWPFTTRGSSQHLAVVFYICIYVARHPSMPSALFFLIQPNDPQPFPSGAHQLLPSPCDYRLEYEEKWLWH